MSNENPSLKILSLGLTEYRDVWESQKEIQRELIANSGEQTLIFCEHHPVITYGKSSNSENLLTDPKTLLKEKIEVIEVERGGDYTFHGPGQLVVYPLLDLRTKKRDVGWYLRTLEEVVLKVLESYTVKGERIEGKTGVWVSDNGEMKKICSMGVRISRWCTLHGLAINVKPQGEGFQAINPCGFDDISMVSLMELGIDCSLAEVEDRVTEVFCREFQYTVER